MIAAYSVEVLAEFAGGWDHSRTHNTGEWSSESPYWAGVDGVFIFWVEVCVDGMYIWLVGSG